MTTLEIIGTIAIFLACYSVAWFVAGFVLDFKDLKRDVARLKALRQER